MIAGSLSLPDLSWCEPGHSRRWRTTRLMDCKVSGVVVPPFREFESSVPRWLWWLWSPDDPRFLKSALIHDVLIERGDMKEYADSQWLAVALDEGAPESRARVAHLLMTARRFWQWAASKKRMTVVSEKYGQFSEFWVLFISVLGLSLEPHVFVGCILMSASGTTLTRHFAPMETRRALGLSLFAGLFVSFLAMLFNQMWLQLPPQIPAAVGGLLAVVVLPWVLRRFPALADKVADRVVGK